MENTERNLSQSLSDAEKQKIQARAQELISLLTIWASLYPVVRAQRVPPVAMLIATVLPELPLPVLTLVGKLIMFIFAVDDVADEKLLSYFEFRQAGKAWQEIALTGQASQPVSEDGHLSAMTAEIRGELAHYRLFNDLAATWSERLGQLCEAMAKEYAYGLNYKASGGKTLPDLDEYVESGIHSVGFPFWGFSVLILLSEPVVLEKMAPLNEIILQTGAAIRLYNDIRTYEKEVQEDNINAITILEKALALKNPALAPEERFKQAEASVSFLAGRYAEKCYTLVENKVTTSGQFEQMIRRIVAFHAKFYGSHQHSFDYHTISSSDSFSLIQGIL